MSDRKPGTIDKVKWALYRTAPSPGRRRGPSTAQSASARCCCSEVILEMAEATATGAHGDDRLAHPICLVAADADVPLRAVDPARCIRTVASLDDLHAELKALAGSEPPGTRALDLIGHSTRDHHFLRIGDQAIDMTRPLIARLFETIRREELLQQLGVIAVRLLGCSTALLPTGQRTLQRLARTPWRARLRLHRTAAAFALHGGRIQPEVRARARRGFAAAESATQTFNKLVAATICGSNQR